MSTNSELYKLKEDFLEEWPIERLKIMPLEEYTNLDKTSFCYWLEAITTDIGSIWGGSAYKFGIFKRKDLESENYNDKRKSDGVYAWYGKYGDTREEVYDKVRETVINIATLSQQNNLDQIEQIDFGDGIKWKIAFLYGDYNVIDIFNHNGLKTSAKYLGYNEKDQRYPALNKYILSQKGDKDYFDFAKELWDVFNASNSTKSEFEKWLKSKIINDSKKVSSYLRAIDILISNFKIDIYIESEIEVLEELYEDLKLHQKDEKGKYYFSKANSYGTAGFYSAAVGSYIEFLKLHGNAQLDSSDEERLISLLKEIGHDDSRKFYSIMQQILSKLSIETGDIRICYSLPKSKKRIGLTFGQKLCAVIDRKKERNRFRYLDTTYDEENWLKETESISVLTDSLNAIILSGTKELNKTNKTGFEAFSSLSLEKSLFDNDYESYIFKKAFSTDTTTKDNNMKAALNQIFFGPPGTGKTYNMINEALSILEPIFYKENKGNRDSLNKRFKELLIKNWDNTNGQIAFCTFHQSFSYEDFVEGIKPKTNDKKEVYYEIEDGIFKKICQLANSSISAAKMNNEGKLSWDAAKFEQSSFYKLSLGESNNINDSLIYEYCRDNNVVSVGFGDDTNFSGMTEEEINRKCEELDLSVGTAQRLNYFIHDLKNENYVIVSNGNRYIRCLGKVTGDYEYIEDSPIDYHHFRKVEWIFVDENIPVEEVYDTNFNQKTIYKLDKNRLKKEFFVNHAHKVENETKKVKDYILIIDEINRGNVSSIFGELITLIEPDKRAGKVEELEVTLPYSKEPFKVPHNVYIVGTMNTADRSIEALDTALRRRFSFVEKPPVPELIRNEGKSGKVNGIVNGINLQKVLESINKRIEKLIDKDHKIGHSYFLKVNDKESLINCFENEVIPLLEEYFFGDYGKIGLVLGDSFVAKDQTEDFKFAEFAGYDADVSSDLKERSVYKIRPSKDWDFNSI